MSILRAGILGCGGIAHKHAQALAELNGEVELVALCGRDESRVRAFAAQEKAEHAAVFTDFRDMFDQADLDLVHLQPTPKAIGFRMPRVVSHPMNLSNLERSSRGDAARKPISSSDTCTALRLVQCR